MSTGLNSNSWYYVYYDSVAPTSKTLFACPINDSGTAGIVGQQTNATAESAAFQWQVLPIGATNTYVVRSRSLGYQWTMGVGWQFSSDLPGTETRIAAQNYNSPASTPKSAQWMIESTRDGTGKYYLSTVSNGTRFHLDFLGGLGFLKEASLGGNGMKWLFQSVSAIDDPQWSYTSTSTATATSATATVTTTSPASNAVASSTSTSSNSPQQTSMSSNNVTSISTIVCYALLGLAFLALFIVTFLFHRLRRRKQIPPPTIETNLYGISKNELDGQQIYLPPFSPAVRSQPGLHEKSLTSYKLQHPAHRDRERSELPGEPSDTVSSRSDQ